MIDSSFTLGGIAAESDHLLATSYYDNGDYRVIASRYDQRCIIVGRTGAGKSAALAQLERESGSQRIIRVIPENLSLPYLTNLDVVKQLVSLGVRLDPFLKALWKHVILVEVIRHRYRIHTPEMKANILAQLKERFAKDPVKVKALEYLDTFGDKFWCETDERVRQIAESFEEQINLAADLGINSPVGSIGFNGGTSTVHRGEIRAEVADKYQRVVNEAQLPRLNDMIVILNNEMLDSEQHFTYLIIDDLDKEWVDESIQNLMIKCLFEAVVDMLRVKNLKIIVALRTNLLHKLEFGAQSAGGQEEKYRGLVIPLEWTRNDLRHLLEQRVEAATEFYGLDSGVTLSTLLPNSNKTRGDALEHIIDRTLMRPRDAILYLNACLREATGKRAVSWEHIQRAELRYSEERLLALRDEWKDPYLDIDRFFSLFRGVHCELSIQELTGILDDAAMLLADPNFNGTRWLEPMCSTLLSKSSPTVSEAYDQLVTLLLTTGLLGVRLSNSRRPNYIYETHDVPSLGDLGDNDVFTIHPAFRKALRCA